MLPPPPHRAELRACLIVHRHGDRSPGVNLFSGAADLETAERAFWSVRVPTGSDARLASRFPIPHVDVIGLPFDDDNHPFALLTKTGQEQLSQLGARLRARYASLIAGPEDVHVRSTNYRRTIDSVRHTLSSLVDFSVPVHVGGEGDPLNPWKYNPGILTGARQLRKSASMLGAEAKAAEVKKTLIAHLPLYQHRPEFFNWVNVGDYFVTRECHQDAVVEGRIEACGETVLEMMAFQFLNFYKDQALRGMVVGPLVHGIHSFFAKKLCRPTLHSDGSHLLHFDQEAKLVIVSGHDQTLLPLMCALGVQRGETYRTSWPLYASSLAFELYELPNGPHVRLVYDNGRGELEVLVPERLNYISRDGLLPFDVFTNVILNSKHARI